MAISKEIIDTVRDSLNIVEVVSEYIPTLKRVGKDYSALCPFHSEKSPSFYVSPAKNMFHCFGCKAGGDVFKFVMLIENISYPEAIKKLASHSNIEIKEIDEGIDRDRKVIFEILKDTTVFYHNLLVNTDEGLQARKYLVNRAINQKTIQQFQIGYAPAGSKLLQSLQKKYSVDLLRKAGVVAIVEQDNRAYDFLQDRIIFPICDFTGQVIAFGGRALKKDALPVYLNTPDTTVYSKSRTLYGLFQARQALNKTKQAIVLEGYIDVLISHQYGIENTVAPLGTSLTTGHLRLLKRYVESMYLVFDSDESGNIAAIRAGELCLENDIACRIVSLPELNTDPDEYILSYGKDKFNTLISTGLHPVEFKLEKTKNLYNLSIPENKSKFVRNILETLLKIKDSITRQEMLKFIAVKTQVPESIIVSEIRKHRGIKKVDSENSLLAQTNLHIRSIEEEIIFLCLRYPHLIKFVPSELFTDERCMYCFPLIHQISGRVGLLDNKYTLVKLVESVESVDKDIGQWLMELLFEEREYNSPEQTLEILISDLNLQRQEEKRRQLESEVIPMWEGKVPQDIKKIKEFQELTRLLKGTQQ